MDISHFWCQTMWGLGWFPCLLWIFIRHQIFNEPLVGPLGQRLSAFWLTLPCYSCWCNMWTAPKMRIIWTAQTMWSSWSNRSIILYHKPCLGISIWTIKTAKNVYFWKMENFSFWPELWHFLPKGCLKACIIMYLGNIHNMTLVQVSHFQILFRSDRISSVYIVSK